MNEMLPLSERLRLVANVSDLMLAGSMHAYRPESRSSATIVHEGFRSAA